MGIWTAWLGKIGQSSIWWSYYESEKSYNRTKYALESVKTVLIFLIAVCKGQNKGGTYSNWRLNTLESWIAKRLLLQIFPFEVLETHNAWK